MSTSGFEQHGRVSFSEDLHKDTEQLFRAVVDLIVLHSLFVLVLFHLNNEEEDGMQSTLDVLFNCLLLIGGLGWQLPDSKRYKG